MTAEPVSPTLANKLQILMLRHPHAVHAIEELVDHIIATNVRPSGQIAGDVLFDFQHGDQRWRCELCDHQVYGIEARFFADGAFRRSQLFQDRARAVAWAESERRRIEHG